MSLLAPLGLIGLVALPVIVAFWMLRLRRPERDVSSTFLWQHLVRDVEANSPWQRLRYLLAPSALPYFMAALKIAGGLSLIGAVVAEFVAGTAGQSTGLASRILESSFRNEIPRMFAALLLLSLTGIVIFFALSLVSHLLLRRWHESAIVQEV